MQKMCRLEVHKACHAVSYTLLQYVYNLISKSQFCYSIAYEKYYWKYT